MFGTRPKPVVKSNLRQYIAARGALPALPAALSSSVESVVPTTAGPAVLHHAATSSLDGTDFRRAYTPATKTPSNGTNGAKTTIATVQFADFNHNGTSNAAASDAAADLSTYATNHGLADPVANGHYHAVHVDGGPSASDDKLGDDIEVDLDQESILSTAPSAKQQPYFAPNTNAGFGDIFSAVFDDVTGDSTATAPDPNITVLSSSWGGCESATGASAIQTVEPILQSLVAAGVTVFSASGDDGIYDCRSASGTGLDNSQADVDYPASSPYVVGVGGTNLSASKSSGNTGTNWTEAAWNCTKPTSCQSTAGTGGSGGGASGSAHSSTTADSFAGFAAPSYQQSGINDAPFAGATKRLVPDIAADGDPSTGFVLYTSDPQYVAQGGGNNLQVGGTSLATPVSAALLDNALADSGRNSGVGDIHAGLYTAYRATLALSPTSANRPLRDVVSGSNGAAADRGSDPSVKAQTGYDTTSGVGGVLWSALVPYLTGTGQPTSTGALTLPNFARSSGHNLVRGTWTSARGGDSSPVVSTAVKVYSAAAPNKAVYSTTSSASSGTFSFTGVGGTTYFIAVTPTNSAGRSATVSTRLLVPLDDTVFTFSSGWSRSGTTGDFASTHNTAATKGLSATASGTGHYFYLNARTGPGAGKIGAYVGGKLVATVDEYAAAVGHARVQVHHVSSTSKQTLTFTSLGQKAYKSSGTSVNVDALTVAY